MPIVMARAGTFLTPKKSEAASTRVTLARGSRGWCVWRALSAVSAGHAARGVGAALLRCQHVVLPGVQNMPACLPRGRSL